MDNRELIVVEGGHPITGTLRVSGAKNSVLKLMEQYPGYEPIITDKLPGNIEIISAQYGNSFITTSPSMGFEIFEQSLSNAVYEYAGRIGGRSSREDAARRLKQAL